MSDIEDAPLTPLIMLEVRIKTGPGTPTFKKLKPAGEGISSGQFAITWKRPLTVSSSFTPMWSRDHLVSYHWMVDKRSDGSCARSPCAKPLGLKLSFCIATT